MSAPALVDDLNPEVADERIEVTAASLKLVEDLRAQGAVTATKLDLSPVADITYERYEALGVYLGAINRSCSWWVGDWLLFGEGTFSDRYAQAAHVTGLSEGTLLNRVYVARNVPPSRRRASLSFSLHQEVAPLSPKEQKHWLDRAEKAGWNRADLRNAMKAKRKDEKPPLFDDDDEKHVDHMRLEEAAKRVVSARKEYGADYLVPREAMAQLIAAVGEEE